MKKIINELNYHELPTDEFREKNRIFCLNENPYGCSNKVIEAFSNFKIDFNEYPDDNCTSLRRKIGRLYSISENEVLIGNGSGEILQILSRSFLNAGDEVISCAPTYPYYLVETVIEDAIYKEVELKNDKFDIDGIIDSVTDKTKIIYITNPNNPLGTIINEEEANRLINSIRKDILIVFDEAYYEFVTASDFPNILGKIRVHDNVCILRTFSKAYGLAAVRVGYIIGNEKMINALNKVRLTFNVSKISQLLAEAAIDDQSFIESCRNNNKEQKERIYKYLENNSINYIDSEANFIMIEDNNKNMYNKLKEKNIIVKSIEYNGKDYIRLSIGNKEDIDEIINII